MIILPIVTFLVFYKKEEFMIIAIPSVGVVILLLLLAYLFLGAPVGSARSLLITLINVLVVGVIIYLVLSLFQVI